MEILLGCLNIRRTKYSRYMDLEDIGNYFGAIPSGLNIYDNSYEIAFRSKKKPGTLTTILRITPEITGLAFENHVISAKDNRDNAWIFGSYLDNKRVITGAIPAGKRILLSKELFLIRQN